MGKQYWKPGNMLYPLPAVMVSCRRQGERPNIITVAWSGTVNTDVPMLYISVRKSRYSYDILRETREFVVNLVNKDLTYAADFCGVRSGRDGDKFAEMKLTELPSKNIKAPGIAESPVNIECRVKKIMPLGSHDMFLAKVTAVQVDESLLDEKGKLDLNKAHLVAYSHGEYQTFDNILGTFGYSVKKKDKKEKKKH